MALIDEYSTHNNIKTMDERDQKARQDELNEEVVKLQKVSVVQDESFHWYVIPEKLLPFFHIDEEDYSMIDSGQFDDKWRKYRTGGDLNRVQLYAVIKE